MPTTWRSWSASIPRENDMTVNTGQRTAWYAGSALRVGLLVLAVFAFLIAVLMAYGAIHTSLGRTLGTGFLGLLLMAVATIVP
jgi:hypothetical protein